LIPTLLDSFLIRNGQLPVNTVWSTKIVYFEQWIEHPLAIVGTTGLYIRVQRLLGHADLQMATGYVQGVPE
jgi:hypothetical protein